MLDYLKKPVLVLGCGNILFGDDGFGPAVIECLKKNYRLPPEVGLLDTGSGVRKILFDITLSQKRPKKIIIVDAVDTGRSPGEVFELTINDLPENKTDDFSMHQLPTSNLLKELSQFCNVEVKIISAQVENIPQEVKPGLSQTLLKAVPHACERILKICTNGKLPKRP